MKIINTLVPYLFPRRDECVHIVNNKSKFHAFVHGNCQSKIWSSHCQLRIVNTKNLLHYSLLPVDIFDMVKL